MINKTITLGRNPTEVGVKDAIHVAIVSVRAGEFLHPGRRVTLNEHREAVNDAKGIGVADPFLKGRIEKGENLWILMDASQVANVQHTWDHELDFSPPERVVAESKQLACHADKLGVTYTQLMDAARKLVDDGTSSKYEGILSEEDLENVQEEMWDFWYDWAEETGHEFGNMGTVCCPEPMTPDGYLFTY